jgi:hypothetical protein
VTTRQARNRLRHKKYPEEGKSGDKDMIMNKEGLQDSKIENSTF